MEDERRLRPWPVVREEAKGDFEMFQVRAIHARSPRDGSLHAFHLADSPDGVTVVALTEDEEVVMVEQWRHPLRSVTLELPSGVMEPGESPEHAAARELREETGYAGDEPRVIGASVLNPSWQTPRLYAVVVRGARRAGEKELDEGEDTRVRLLPLPEVRRKVAAGEIDSATTVAALALFAWRAEGE